MKRLVILMFLFLLLVACGEKTSDSGSFLYTFTDSTGETVTLREKPETVAVLFSSYAEIWTLAGGEADITVGESVERGFVSSEVSLVDNGAGKTIDYELLLAQKPDFVIGSADIPAHVDVCRTLKKNGIACALFRVDTFDDYLSMLRICTDITGKPENFETYGTEVEKKISAVKEASSKAISEKKNILFIRAGSKFSATKAKRAPDNFVCIMLKELGSHNIADDAEILLDGLSTEEILIRDPDHIFLVTMGSETAAKAYIEELFRKDGWKNLSAVRNGNYTFLPKDLFHFKPNARWAEAYTILAELLYPELKIHG